LAASAILIFGLFLAQCAKSEEAEPSGAALLEGSILPGSTQGLIGWLDSVEPDSSVDLYINSPGGDVASAWAFIASMSRAQVRGITVRCYVYGQAASAAFWILSECDGRYATPQSAFMFHRIRQTLMGDLMTAPLARKMARSMQQVDNEIALAILQHTSQSPAEVWRSMEAEDWYTARALRLELPGFLTAIYPAFPNLLTVGHSKTTPRLGQPGQPGGSK
jgi:ATP-dependent protease ClpP protease subunit